MIVQGAILIENKAVQALAPAHEVQLVNYLTAAGIEIGLLLNLPKTPLRMSPRASTTTTSPAHAW